MLSNYFKSAKISPHEYTIYKHKKTVRGGRLERMKVLKFLLPLIAALKVDCSGKSDGWSLGVAVAQAYKGCRAEINRQVDRSQDGVG